MPKGIPIASGQSASVRACLQFICTTQADYFANIARNDALNETGIVLEDALELPKSKNRRVAFAGDVRYLGM